MNKISLFSKYQKSVVLALLCVVCSVVLLLGNTNEAFAVQEKGANEVNTQQLPDSSFIYDTPIEDLANADSYYDGQTVQVRGEAIGDRIWEGPSHKYCWISLISIKDGQDETISVLMTPEQAKLIDTFGHYGTTGTILQVKGTFHLVCSEHSGESDLHASEVKVIEPGATHPDQFNLNDFIPGILLVSIGVVLTIAFWHLQERGK